MFDAPAYQQQAISRWLKTGDQIPTLPFNASKRGVPDLALSGHKFPIVLGGSVQNVGGTSASSPAIMVTINVYVLPKPCCCDDAYNQDSNHNPLISRVAGAVHTRQ